MKGFLPLIITIFIISILTSSYSNSYSGKYICEVNNIILNLNEDESFKLIKTFSKSSECTYGKYKIENNELVLLSKDNKSQFFNNTSVKGKVEGTKITFSDFLDTKSCVFRKY